MEPVEAEGNSIDEAIGNALKMLGTTRDRVEIEILSNAARGLFGIGGKKARVRATVRAPIDAERVESPRPTRRVVADLDPLDEDAKDDADAATVGGPTLSRSEAVARASQVLQELVRLMQVDCEVAVKEETDRVVLELNGDSSGILIGRRGQMLDALEYLLNRVVTHAGGGSTRIAVDSQDYRDRRRQSLEELARRMGEQAKKKRKSITLNPMSPRDRRIVHMVLQEDGSLTTRSSGKGYFRKLIIIPQGLERSRAGREA